MKSSFTNQLPKRKATRLEHYDYSSNGAYFITICVKDMRCILSTITVGVGVHDDPGVRLTKYGNIVNERIIEMNNVYQNIKAEKFVVMPNHLHILVRVDGGSSRTPTPTNSVLSAYVSTLKRMTNKEIGESIWQRGFHDHIIRDEKDYQTRWQYIDENPRKWLLGKDEYYT